MRSGSESAKRAYASGWGVDDDPHPALGILERRRQVAREGIGELAACRRHDDRLHRLRVFPAADRVQGDGETPCAGGVVQRLDPGPGAVEFEAQAVGRIGSRERAAERGRGAIRTGFEHGIPWIAVARDPRAGPG